MPHSEAGPRIEPPVSEPSAAGTNPAAHEPLDDPPVKCSRFHGLRAGGQGRSNDGPPCTNSWVASLPVRMGPDSYSLRTVVASAEGTVLRHTREWPVVRIPAVE